MPPVVGRKAQEIGQRQYDANLADFESAKQDWQVSRDEKLKDAFENGNTDWFADSPLRPANTWMWIQSRPEALRGDYDKAQQEFQKRMDYNNYVREAMQNDKNNKLKISPWMMHQPVPPPAIDENGKPVQMRWPIKR